MSANRPACVVDIAAEVIADVEDSCPFLIVQCFSLMFFECSFLFIIQGLIARVGVNCLGFTIFSLSFSIINKSLIVYSSSVVVCRRYALSQL